IGRTWREAGASAPAPGHTVPGGSTARRDARSPALRRRGPARTGRPRRAGATPARGARLARATVPRVRPWAEPGRAVSPRDVRWETASPRSVERSDRGAAG